MKTSEFQLKILSDKIGKEVPLPTYAIRRLGGCLRGLLKTNRGIDALRQVETTLPAGLGFSNLQSKILNFGRDDIATLQD